MPLALLVLAGCQLPAQVARPACPLPLPRPAPGPLILAAVLALPIPLS